MDLLTNLEESNSSKIQEEIEKEKNENLDVSKKK